MNVRTEPWPHGLFYRDQVVIIATGKRAMALNYFAETGFYLTGPGDTPWTYPWTKRWKADEVRPLNAEEAAERIAVLTRDFDYWAKEGARDLCQRIDDERTHLFQRYPTLNPFSALLRAAL